MTRTLALVMLPATLAIGSSALAADGQTSRPTPASPGAVSTPQRPATPPVTTAAPSATKPAARGSALHINAYGLFTYQKFAASKSFDANFGTSGAGFYGAGSQVWHRSGLFAQAEYARMKLDGEQVFVHNSTVYRLGIPMHIELEFFEVGVGYKLLPKPRKALPPQPSPRPRPVPGAIKGAAGAESSMMAMQQGKPAPKPAASPRSAPAGSRFPVTPYVAAGIGRVAYSQFGDFAQNDEDPSGSHLSYHALGGIEVPLWKWIGLNAEVLYRWVPNAIGEGGVSAEFGETDLGGPAIRVKLRLGR